MEEKSTTRCHRHHVHTSTSASSRHKLPASINTRACALHFWERLNRNKCLICWVLMLGRGQTLFHKTIPEQRQPQSKNEMGGCMRFKSCIPAECMFVGSSVMNGVIKQCCCETDSLMWHSCLHHHSEFEEKSAAANKSHIFCEFWWDIIWKDSLQKEWVKCVTIFMLYMSRQIY